MTKKNTNGAPTEDEKSEGFESTTIATMKAVARIDERKKDAPKLRFVFTKGSQGHLDQRAETVLQLRKPISEHDKYMTRGQSDHFAYRLRHHNAAKHAQNRPGNEKANPALYFDLLEKLRTDAIGSRELKGVAQNISYVFHDRMRQHIDSLQRQEADGEKKRMAAFELLAHQALSGQELKDDLKAFAQPYQEWFDETFAPYHDRFVESLKNQDAFDRTSLDFLADIFPELTPKPDESEPSDEPQEDEDENIDVPADNDSSDNNEDDDQQQSKDSSSTERREIDAQQSEKEGGTSDDDQLSEDHFHARESSGESGGGGYRPKPLEEDPLFNDYKIYTKEYDETVTATELCDPLELRQLRKNLIEITKDFREQVRYVGRKLKNFLLSQQMTSWDFDQEEGLLDTARLSRVVTNPTSPLSFKRENYQDYMDTVVTILVDNSGSMRGRPIATAATCTDILAEALEQCGIKTEILGYTTKGWKGGRTRDQWIYDGKPSNPGRLNDLRHIVYKPANRPLRSCRDNFGLMLKEGLLKENIDGEALIWGYKRLLKRPEHRKILIVISDGAPVDDATSSANSGRYLEKHLKHVIKSIEGEGRVELSAIGIGHNVGQYYQNSVTISDVENLAKTLADRLLLLFASGTKGANNRAMARIKKQIERQSRKP